MLTLNLGSHSVFWGLEWRRVDLLKHIRGIWLQMLLLILEHKRKVKGQRPAVSGILIFFNFNWLLFPEKWSPCGRSTFIIQFSLGVCFRRRKQNVVPTPAGRGPTPRELDELVLSHTTSQVTQVHKFLENQLGEEFWEDGCVVNNTGLDLPESLHKTGRACRPQNQTHW